MKFRALFCIFNLLFVNFEGCAAMSTSIQHKDLVVESKMSESIFLDPVDEVDRTVYVEVKNTSSEDLTTLAQQIKQDLTNGGYKVVDKPTKAHDIIQVNVLQFGQAKNPEEVWKSTDSGFGSVMTGAVAGIATGVATGSTAWGVGVGAGVAAASWIADQMVTDKTYSLITDLQLSVRKNATDFEKHKTRVASMADQVIGNQ